MEFRDLSRLAKGKQLLFIYFLKFGITCTNISVKNQTKSNKQVTTTSQLTYKQETEKKPPSKLKRQENAAKKNKPKTHVSTPLELEKASVDVRKAINTSCHAFFFYSRRCKKTKQPPHEKVRSWANSLNYKRKHTNLFLIDFFVCICIIHDCPRIPK